MTNLYQVRLHFIISLSCSGLSHKPEMLVSFFSTFSFFFNTHKLSHPIIFSFFLVLISFFFFFFFLPLCLSHPRIFFLLSSFPLSSQIKDPFLEFSKKRKKDLFLSGFVLFMVALGLWVEIGVVVGSLWSRTPWWLLGFCGGSCGFLHLMVVSLCSSWVEWWW